MQRLKSNPIQELRRILRDQYSFSSIVKELIQNADDAGAEEFHLAWALDWPLNTHPLLTGPAVVVLNDGVFRSADAQAICLLDEGAKGADVGTIGKYGLGMKSVFHLCEGFFYAASRSQPAADGSAFVELLNPWPEGGPHDNWGDLTQAKTAILEKVSGWAHGCEPWFCLVIPLRTQAHLDGAEAIVRGEFPTIDQLPASFDAHELAALTPLLGSLSRITVWRWDDRTRRNKVLTSICCDDDQRHRRLFPKLAPGSTQSLSTKVIDRSDDQEGILIAAGAERLLDDPVFDRLKDDDRWPKNFTLNPVTGKSEDTLEKADPHCAAVFAQTVRSRSCLDIRYAVFLPLSKGLVEQVPVTGEKHYELTLHGQFFLDAGRRELYRTDGDGSGLQETWNKCLLRRGVLPLVLPALDEFVRTWSLSRSEVEVLTTAVSESSLFQRHREDVCSSHNWLACTDFDTQGVIWQLVDSRTPFFLLPSLAGRRDTAHELFPALPRVCRDQVVSEEDKPRLTLEAPAEWNAREDLLRSILESANLTSMAHKKSLELAADFLGLLDGVMSETAARILSEKLAQTVVAHGIRALDKVKESFVALIERSPACVWVRLGPIEKDAASVYRDLNGLGLNHVVLPPDLVPLSETGDQLSIGEAQSIFSWLESTAQSRPPERTSAIALSVIAATAGSLEEKVARLGEAPLFLARDGAAEGRGKLLPWRTLRELFRDHRLFSGGSAQLRALQQALRDTKVYSLYAPREARPFLLLFDCAEPRHCDTRECLMLLGRRQPRLAAPEHRVHLLDRVIPALSDGSDAGQLRAIRFLTHANPKHTDDLESDLFIRPQGGGTSHLAKVAEHALRRMGCEWRWIADCLWRRLNSTQQEVLHLTAIDARAVESLLAEAGTEWIRELGLSDAEATDLLQDVRDSDLWHRLPLHQTISGTRISLETPYVYLQPADEFTLPERLGDVVTILRRPRDESLAQRYRLNGVVAWTEQAAIEVALAQPAPSDYAAEVLGAVGSLCESNARLPADLREKLKNTPWIPTKAGRAVPASDVIHLPQLDDHLQRLLADPEVGHAFTCTAHLSESLVGHRAIGLLRQRGVFPDRLESFRILALCLGQVPRYRIGETPEISDDARGLKLLLASFAGVGPGTLPVLSLLQELSESYPDDVEEIARRILPELRKELPFATLTKCVLHLAKQCCTRDARHGGKDVAILGSYLRQFLAHSDYSPEHLQDLLLPNKLRQLKPTHALCVRAEGIDPACLLHEELARLFPSEHDTRFGEDALVADTEATPPTEDPMVLVQYMRGWEGLVPKQLRGGLLALFGDDETILKHASDLLHPLSVRNFRAELEWPVHGFSKMIGANEDIHTTMAAQRFVFQVGDSSSLRRVPSLLSRWFDAPIGGEIDSIFLGSLWASSPAHRARPGFRVKVITLREFDPAEVPQQRRRAVLFASALLLLKDVYNRKPQNLNEVWEKLSHSGQVELEIVQDQLLKNAWFYFQQLGDRRLRNLDTLLRRYDDLSDREIELRRSTAASAQKDMREIQRDLAEMPSELRSLLEGDAQVQNETLNAVRSKMRDYEYSANSVPFELFQNADDAAAELADMLGEDTPDVVHRVVFSVDEHSMTLIHWGRPINEFCRGNFSADEGRSRGYDKDLKKMLILAASDKSERSELVTGKFGLGFKSVFFLTDRPQVLSGALAFEVLGGFFPRQVSSETVRALSEKSEFYGRSEAEATIINLPVAASKAHLVRDALNKFEEFLPFSLIFARHIKECVVCCDGDTRTVQLDEQPIADCPGASVCRIVRDFGGRSAGMDRFLVLKADGSGSVFLALGPNGFRRIPKSVPTFWVTAPTKTLRDAGVVIHGYFAVDVGRNQLAESEDNQVLAQKIGDSVGATLVELFDAAAQWTSMRNELHLAQDARPEDLWLSLWELLSHDGVRRDPILRAVFCSAPTGLMHLVGERAALPTGLPAPFDGLTQLSGVRAEVSGILDQDESTLKTVLKWPALKQAWQAGHLVSGQRVAAVLREALSPSEMPWTQFTLLNAMQTELGDTIEVEPPAAKRLGDVFNRKKLQAWEHRHGEELDRIRQFLNTLRFRTVDGGCSTPSDLIASQLGGDEARRAAFAPAERRLSPAYAGNATDFFLACRPEMRAPILALEDWAKAAEPGDSRAAVLRYLLEGELSRGLAQELRRDGRPSWLDDISDSCLASFSDQEKLQIRAMLGLGYDELRSEVYEELSKESHPEKAAQRVVSDTQATLDRIRQWWEAHGPESIARLDKQVYPRGRFFAINREAPKGNHERCEWLKLFLLGSLQTIGWTSPEINRNFIEHCEQRGWFEDLAAAQTQPDRWLESWMAYVSEQETEIRYFQWMKHLVGLALIGMHLDDYVELFLAADRIETDFSLPAITRPRTSAFFQGGGPDAPPVSEVLGIGQCFIMRELARHDVLRSERVYPHCYVPFKRTRQVVEALGGPQLEGIAQRRWERSREIFVFLKEHLGPSHATLGRCFDIPLMLIGGDSELWERLLFRKPDELPDTAEET